MFLLSPTYMYNMLRFVLFLYFTHLVYCCWGFPLMWRCVLGIFCMHVERLSVWSLVRLSIFFLNCLKSVAGTVCLKCPSCSKVKTDVCHSRFFFGLVCNFFFFSFFFLLQLYFTTAFFVQRKTLIQSWSREPHCLMVQLKKCTNTHQTTTRPSLLGILWTFWKKWR